MAGSFESFIGINCSEAASRSGQQIYVADPHRREPRITLHSAPDALPEEARILGVQVPG
jgi:hypothetical protein